MKQYIVDAFTDKVFSGNPAAVCISEEWLPDETMKNITRENNLAETAFAIERGDKYQLRWFTPEGEIDLCGHATLACAYVIFNYIKKDSSAVVFETLSGELTVTKQGDFYEMDFPAYTLHSVPVTKQMTDAIGAAPKEAYLGRDLLCVFENETIIKELTPNLEKVKELDGLLLHVTAQGNNVDCVSRTFAPKCNVPEDQVCGSGHCHIIPYWAEKQKKEKITAYQASERGGTLYCKMEGDRVKLGGKAAVYSIGEIFIG